MNDAIRVQLSAYVDGELPGNEAEMLLRRVCQDAEIRHQVAEYLALRRFLRGEAGLAAADRLYERVAAEIDHRPVAQHENQGGVVRAVRPLAGFAIAAGVALLAIFGLQQIDTGDDGAPAGTTDTVAHSDAGTNRSVPDIGRRADQHRQLFLNHANASSRLGANGMNSRLIVLRFSEEFADESIADDERSDEQGKAVDREEDNESVKSVAQP